MDSRLRELERRFHGGEATEEVAMLIFQTLRRAGSKIRFRSFPTPQVGIHVRRQHRGFRQGPLTRVLQDEFWYVANTNAKPETRCKHKHKKKTNAVKCAKRHAYRHLLKKADSTLICKYICIGA